MEEKEKSLPVWQWGILGVLVVGLIGLIVNYFVFSGNGASLLQIPGIQNNSVPQEQEYIPEPTSVPGS